MTGRIAVLAIDAVRPDIVAEFWCAVLGWEIAAADTDCISIAPPDRTWPIINVFAVPEAKSVKNRPHLDLRADDSAPSRSYNGCWISVLGEWMSARLATSAGSSSPTPRVMSSACSPAPYRTC
jgi:Glyoxalase-like domain